MTPIYDPKILAEVARKLYAQASAVQFLYGFVGLIVGGVATGGAQVAFANASNPLYSLLGGMVGALVGVIGAGSRALALKAQAQTLLCQIQIEQNTSRLANMQTRDSSSGM
jgi:uncharacterized membrane protein YdcZ (DUF606 family)